MSLAATCWWTLARTVVLCLLAWPVCHWIERTVQSLSPGAAWWYLIALLIPFCFPELLVGYAFRDVAMAHPAWAELLCSGLLLIRIIPVGAIALLAAPPSAMDAAALQCRRLAMRHERFVSHWKDLLLCYWHGPIARSLPAVGLMSIVAFQEFELAALLQTMSWTDWFVTAQRLGLERNEMLLQALWPVAWQLPLLMAVYWWLRSMFRRHHDLATRLESINHGSDQRRHWLGLSCVGVSLICGCLIPLGLIGWRTVEGFAMFARQRPQQLGLLREILIAGSVAICAGLSAWAISSRPSLAGLLGLPGLFGSLLLGLGMVAAFQSPWLHTLYDTPVPWVLALILWLLPRALMLRLWLSALHRTSAIHLATLVQHATGTASRNGSALVWRLWGQSQFLAASLLCFWAYCDLPSAYLLAPTGMASGLVRLYNSMHFGRSAALSSEAILFFGTPVACISLLLFVRGMMMGRHATSVD